LDTGLPSSDIGMLFYLILYKYKYWYIQCYTIRWSGVWDIWWWSRYISCFTLWKPSYIKLNFTLLDKFHSRKCRKQDMEWTFVDTLCYPYVPAFTVP
jgi:hypothetical protein